MEKFKTPDFKEFLQNNDLNGYMVQLWAGFEAKDTESIRILQFIAYSCCSPYSNSYEKAADILVLNKILVEKGDEFGVMFQNVWDDVYGSMDELEKADDKKVNYIIHLLYEEVYTIFIQKDCGNKPPKNDYRRLFKDEIYSLETGYRYGIGKSDKENEEDVELVYDENYEKAKAEWEKFCFDSPYRAYKSALPYAKKGDPCAMFHLGLALHAGEESSDIYILKPDTEKAVEWILKAADAGYPDAFGFLASYYRYDNIDKEKYEHYCRMGAEMGLSECINLILSDMKDINDPKARFETLLHFAEQSEEAQLQLLECYREGIGTEKDEKKAFAIMLQLAEKSLAYKLQLADYYAKGIGTEKDEKKAFEIIKDIYDHTMLGITNSYHEDAAHTLIRYYRNGIGTEADPEKAEEVLRELERDMEKLDDCLSR